MTDNTIIEDTAIALCAAFYDANRVMGNPCLDPKTGLPYKNERKYIKRNFEKFIPVAVNQLINILHGDYPLEMKEPIYQALLTRVEFQPMINGAPVGQYLQ